MATASTLHPPAQELVDAPVLARLRRRSDIIGVALIAHAWGVIFAAMTLFAFYPNPLTFLLAVMLIGARQLGLAILMHDASHNALMTTPERNDSFSDWFCAWPIGSRTAAYRHYHLKHHARTQQEDDPDLILSAPFPITRKSMRRKLVRDLTGQTGFKQRKAQFLEALGTPDMTLAQRVRYFFHKLGGILLTQAILLALCAVIFHWSYYVLFWVVPILTYHMAITRMRNIAEHAIVPDDNDPFRNARTTHAGWLARAFVAPYWVNYHVEHHLLMYIPCYRLPALRRALLARGLGGRMETAQNYLEILRRAASRPDDEDNSSPQTPASGHFAEGFSAQ